MNEERESGMPAMDAEMRQALGHFREAMTAWGDAAYSRPRTMSARATHLVWRRVLGWTLGCVLVTLAAGGVLMQQRRNSELASHPATQQKNAAAPQAAQIAAPTAASVAPQAGLETGSAQASAQKSGDAQGEELLAQVDSDVAREVPDAMEPLAQLLAEDASQDQHTTSAR